MRSAENVAIWSVAYSFWTSASKVTVALLVSVSMSVAYTYTPLVWRLRQSGSVWWSGSVTMRLASV